MSPPTASGSSKRCLSSIQLDILVNNACRRTDKTVRKMSVEDWDRVVGINLSGAFYLSRAVLQHMLDRGYGRIINISLVIGEKGNIGQANYAAAKSGLFGLTNSLALETARKGITVNLRAAPGFIATEMVAAIPEEAPQAGDRPDPGRSPGRARRGRPSGSSFWPTRIRGTSRGRSSTSTAGCTCREPARSCTWL